MPVMAAHVPFGSLATTSYCGPGPDRARRVRGWVIRAGKVAISGAVIRLTLTSKPSTQVISLKHPGQRVQPFYLDLEPVFGWIDAVDFTRDTPCGTVVMTL